jgi:putative DNA primase/helicase
VNKNQVGASAPDNANITNQYSGLTVNKSFGANPSEFFEGKQFVPKWLADRILLNYSFKTMSGTDEIFVYMEGVYTNVGKELIEGVSQARLGSQSNNRRVNEVVGHITRATRCDRSEFDTDYDIINLENGMFDINKMELTEHTPDYLSLRKSPIIYNADATCPAIDKYIEEVVSPDHVQTIYEICGYTLYGRKNLKRAFIFEGEKNSGKSKMIELIGHLVGDDATTRVSPFDVSSTTYGAAEYYGKQLNLVDDLGNAAIENTGILKSVISGGRINAQFKYAQPFDYTPNVLCIFATNEVPPTKTIDDAYASRFSIVKFPNIFEGDDDDKELMSKLSTPEELSGFFNKCMAALKSLIERGSFTGDGTLADRIKQYQYSSNPVTMFVDDACVVDDPDDYIPKDELYHAYIMWSRDKKIMVGSPKMMTIFLKSIGCVVRRVTTDENDRVYAYFGIRIKSEVSDY